MRIATAGADEQVGVGHEVREQPLRYKLFGDVLGLQGSGLHVVGHVLHDLCQFPSRRVAEHDVHGHGFVAGGSFHAFLQSFLHLGRQQFQSANGAEPDVVLHEYLFLEVIEDERHQCFDFGGRAIPVLGREGVEGQVFDTQPCGFGGNLLHRLHSLGVSCRAWQSFLLCPSSVSIHDDGHVLGYSVLVNHCCDRFYIWVASRR